jgi:hypothetical protein
VSYGFDFARYRLFWTFLADVIHTSPNLVPDFIAFFQPTPGSIQVEAIPTEKKVRVRFPRALASQKAAAFLKYENEHRASLGVLLLHALYLRWIQLQGLNCVNLDNNNDNGILKFLRATFDVCPTIGATIFTTYMCCYLLHRQAGAPDHRKKKLDG